MTTYVVCARTFDRHGRLRPDKPGQRQKDFVSIEAAGEYIRDADMNGEWSVWAQEASKVEPSTPYRQLRDHERKRLNRKIYNRYQ